MILSERMHGRLWFLACLIYSAFMLNNLATYKILGSKSLLHSLLICISNVCCHFVTFLTKLFKSIPKFFYFTRMCLDVSPFLFVLLGLSESCSSEDSWLPSVLGNVPHLFPTLHLPFQLFCSHFKRNFCWPNRPDDLIMKTNSPRPQYTLPFLFLVSIFGSGFYIRLSFLVFW